jgi:hypothetical protein
MNISAIHFFDSTRNYLASQVVQDVGIDTHHALVVLCALENAAQGVTVEHDFFSGDDADTLFFARMTQLNAMQDIRDLLS